MFTLNVPGATFLNLKVVDGKNGEFIAMPQSKGRDGQYYDLYRAYFSEQERAKTKYKTSDLKRFFSCLSFALFSKLDKGSGVVVTAALRDVKRPERVRRMRVCAPDG